MKWYWEQKRRWAEAMQEKGHTPIVNEDGDLDSFVKSFGYHNGPGCSSCGWSTCWHCEGIESIPQCTDALSKASDKEA